MLKRLSGFILLSFSIAFGVLAHENHNHDENKTEGQSVTLYRVFVGDYDAPKITAFDLGEPMHRWLFNTKGQSKLYSIGNSSAVAAVQSDDNQVNFISTGIRFEDHGEHSDIEVVAPKAINAHLSGLRPFHLIEHDGNVSINFDKGGYAEIINEYELNHGHIVKTKVHQNVAHHGVVVPWKDSWLSSVASENIQAENTAPPRVGLRQINTDGSSIGALQTCSDLHGEAFSGHYAAFGCKEGVLTVRAGKKGPEYNMLPYPNSFPEGEITGHLLGSNSFQVFLGSYGKKAVVIVDPAEQPHFKFIELPFRRVDFALDPIHLTDAFVFTEDGKLNRINLLQGEIEQSAQITEPYSMDGHWNAPRPRIAMAGEEILVTDPNQGVIRRIDTKTLKETSIIKYDGKPYNIAVVGGSGIRH